MAGESRYSYWEGDYDDDWGLSLGRWQRNAQQVFKSRRGQRILAELEDMLLAMPERRLLRGELARMETAVSPAFCLVGAYAHHKGIPLREMLIDTQWGSSPDLTAEYGERAGMAYTMAWVLGEVNDDEVGENLSPEERWERVLDWVRRKRSAASTAVVRNLNRRS